jgi:hypothetical protein
VLRTVGRFTLWGLALVLLVRGLSDVLAAGDPAPAAPATRASAPAWPGDDARAFAVRFADAYLGFAPGDDAHAAAALQAFVTPELANAIVPVEDRRGVPPEVRGVVVERTERIDERHALVTVAATVAGSTAPRLLTVPVARDASGGLVVSDLPAFAAPPPRAAVPAPELSSLPAADRGAIEDLLERFLRPFLAGQGDDLAYLVPAGTRIEAVAAPLKLVAVDGVAALPGGTSRSRWVLASVRAGDPASGLIYGLRYRVRVVRGERGMVAAVESSPKGG